MVDTYLHNYILHSWQVSFSCPELDHCSQIIALLTAITHLILFKYLDGALADGPDEKAPQTYINTASQLLANAFQIFLQASLSTSFVQYLWFTLRRSTLRVSTIDTLFLIRFEPLSFRFSAFRAAPQLVCLVLLIWAVYIAAIFPPGALTVGLAPRVTNSLMPVPTFNASYVCLIFSFLLRNYL